MAKKGASSQHEKIMQGTKMAPTGKGGSPSQSKVGGFNGALFSPPKSGGGKKGK